MRISAIAAIGENRELGKNNELIWRITDDLKRVKELTTGHPIIMGRKTYESIGRPLPNRTNIIITTHDDYKAPGCIITASLENALVTARKADDEEIFIFGGAQIYTLALPVTDRLYLTLIHDTEPAADTFFPVYDAFSNVIAKKTREQDGLQYDWLTLERA